MMVTGTIEIHSIDAMESIGTILDDRGIEVLILLLSLLLYFIGYSVVQYSFIASQDRSRGQIVDS